MNHWPNPILPLALILGISSCALNAQAEPPAIPEPTTADLQNSRDRILLKPLYPATKPAAQPVKTKPVTIKSTSGKAKPSVSTAKTPKAVAKTANTATVVAGQPSTAELVLSAWLNHGGQPPTYKVGDKMQITVKASQDCNISVFNFDEHAVLTQIFPNDYQPSGLIKAGETVAIGGPDSPFDYEISGRGGRERIFVYAYPIGVDNPVTVAFQRQPSSPFRSAGLTINDYRKLVNGSPNFFAREVKIVPKSGIKPAATSFNLAPNKIELPFLVNSQ